MIQKRVILFLTTVLTLLGLITYFIMPREEDPKIKRRQAITSVLLPGAPPEKIQRLVVKPIEDELLKVQELKNIEVEIRLNVAVFKLELKDSVKNISDAWQEVERALDKSQAQLPDHISRPILDFSVIAVESVVLAITGSEDFVKLTDTANKVKDHILQNSQVSQVKIFGNPGIEVLVAVESDKLFSKGISIPQLLLGIQQNNLANETGLIIQNGNKYVIHQDNDVEIPEKLGDIKFETGQLNSVNLSELSKITRSTSAEPRSIFRWNGKSAIGLGVIAEDSLNTIQFGQQLMDHIEKIRSDILPYKIETVAYQPKRTEKRLNDLMFSLLSGVALIALFLALTSSYSMALIVSLCVPIISSIGLFVYFLSGGVLHQISIAAFVISIGQFIDNIIVIVDSIQQKMSKGLDKSKAAYETSLQMRWPMAFATLTGICAFLPMLSSEGPTADFTFSLPQIAIITLICSYFVAIYFVPILTEYIIRNEKKPIIQLPLKRLQSFFTSLALGPSNRVIILVSLIFLVSMVSLIKIKKEFFPESDRNEFLFTVELSPSSDIQATDSLLNKIETQLFKDKRVESLASFSGGGIPRFYYNLPNPQQAPQVGQILITTNNKNDIKSLGLELEKEFKINNPGVNFTSNFLQQGPPTNAKIEINIFSEDTERRKLIISEIEGILKNIEGTRSIRPDTFLGLNSLNILSNENKLTDIGLNRNQLNSVLAYYSSGVPISHFRFDRDLIPIVVRDSKGLYKTNDDLLKQKAYRGRSQDYKISDLVILKNTDSTPILRKENGKSFSRILADLLPHYTFSETMNLLKPQISKIKLINNESISYGGEAKGANEANSSIFKVVPLAFTLLILFLLIEFKSFKKLIIALLALPVTIMGVFPGLWLGGAPFGFMSLLGLLALVGVAINNIILLMEAMEEEDSIEAAIESRFRSIFLTTTLTLLGLIPLAIEDSSLWPPLAWTMISGLITGTIATLIVVPALYRIFFKEKPTERNFKLNSAKLTLLIFFFTLSYNPKLVAEEYNLDQIISFSKNTDEEAIESLNIEKYKIQSQQLFRETYIPKIYFEGQVYKRDKDLKVNTPFGESIQEEKDGYKLAAEIRQKIFDYQKMFNQADALNYKNSAEESKSLYLKEVEKIKSLGASIEILGLQRESKFILDSIQNLKSRKSDIIRLVQKGRLSNSDQLKLEIAIEKLKQQQKLIENKISAKKINLEKKLNIENLVIMNPEKINTLNLPDKAQATGDIVFLNQQSQSLQSSAKQVNNSVWPTLEAYYRATSVDGNLLTDKQWDEVGLSAKWEIFGGGVRQAQAKELLVESQQLVKKAAILEKDLSSNFEELKEETIKNFDWMNQLTVLSKMAFRNKKIEESRYYEGRGNLNDLMDADNLHLELSRDQDIINYQIIVGCAQLKLWSGSKITANCNYDEKNGNKL